MAHSIYGFSGQAMIMACPGSVAMQMDIPDQSGEQADKGTAVHTVGEKALLYGCSAYDFVGSVVKGFKITKPMADAANEYVTFVHTLLAQYPGMAWEVEKGVKMLSVDGERLWGTTDFIGVVLQQRKLIIGDYKNGWGIVDVDKEQYVYALGKTIPGNAQLVGYALSALDTMQLWDKVDTVDMFISQPNPDHIDGSNRLVTWSTRDLLDVWHTAYKASHALSIRDDAPRHAGPHCRYCRARGHCGTRITKTMQSLALDKPIHSCTPEQLIALFDDVNAIKSSCDAIVEKLTELSRKGLKVPGHKLVRSIVHAKCTDEDSLVSDALDKGVSEDELYNRRLKGKTAIKSIIGAELANKYYVTPERGYNLVPLTHTGAAVMADQRPDARGRFGKVGQ